MAQKKKKFKRRNFAVLPRIRKAKKSSVRKGGEPPRHLLLTERLFSRRLAAIDIGSNAIRMILAEQNEQNIHILERFRIPIRLGAEVFKDGELSQKTIRKAAKAFKDFSKLAEKFRVRSILAVGTSALRESANSAAFIKAIKKSSGIHVSIIDGVEEARLVHLAVKNQVDLSRRTALLIDVGGGSIELTYTSNELMRATQSFPYGTVRTLQFLKKHRLEENDLLALMDPFLHPLTHFIKSQSRSQRPRLAIGTGGNLESLARLKTKLLNSNDHLEISLVELEEMIARLRDFKVKERIKKLGLRPDRADVIVPAALIVHATLCRAGLKRLLIPHVGLKEGLLWKIAQRSWT